MVRFVAVGAAAVPAGACLVWKPARRIIPDAARAARALRRHAWGQYSGRVGIVEEDETGTRARIDRTRSARALFRLLASAWIIRRRARVWQLRLKVQILSREIRDSLVWILSRDSRRRRVCMGNTTNCVCFPDRRARVS